MASVPTFQSVFSGLQIDEVAAGGNQHAAAHAAMGLPISIFLIPNDPAAAAANTAAIQTALATGASIIIDGHGTAAAESIVWHNGNFVTNGNPIVHLTAFTRLKLMPNLNVDFQPGVNFFIPKVYVDVHLNNIRNFITSLTYANGVITATVDNSNVYIPAVGDIVSVYNAGWGFFNSVARILSVTPGGGTTSFTYRSTGPCTIATAPGIRDGMQYCKAQKATKFTGKGIFDGNYQNGNDGAPSTAGKCGIINCHSYDFSIDDTIEFTNFRQRCVFEWQTLNSNIRKFRVTNCAAGWQSNGTIIDTIIDCMFVQQNQDDAIAAMDREDPRYPEVNMCEGDIINLKILNFRCDNDGGVTVVDNLGTALHCYSFSKLYRNTVSIDGVSGQAINPNGNNYQFLAQGNPGIINAPAGAGQITEFICLAPGIFEAAKMPVPANCPAYVQNVQAGNYTLAASDKNKLIVMNGAAATLTVAASTYVAGERFAVKQGGATLTIIKDGTVQTIWGLNGVVGQYDQIRLNDYSLASNFGIQLYAIYIGEFNISDITPRSISGKVVNQWFAIDPTAAYGAIIIDGIDCTGMTSSGAGSFLIQDGALNYTVENGFNSGTVLIKNIRSNASGDFIYQYAPGAADRRRSITIENFYAGRNTGACLGKVGPNGRVLNARFVNCLPHSGDAAIILGGRVDNIQVEGGAMYGGTLIDLSGGFTYNVVINGYDISENDGGKPLLRINNVANTTVVNCTANGVILGTGVLVAQASGATNTVNPKNFGCTLDVTQAFVSKAVGNVATHLKAAGVNQGPAIANGVAYYQQAQGAAVPALCA